MHGMQIQQPVRALHPGTQLRAAPAVRRRGAIQAFGAPDAVHVLGNEARRIVIGVVEAVECIQVAECQRQAAAIVAPLRAFGVRRIVSSDALRCRQTVAPLEKKLGRTARVTAKISQDAWENGTEDIRAVVGRRVRARKAAVLCSHGPVLPGILSELALATGTMHGSYVDSASSLGMAGFSVVHLSATNPGSGIISIETHEPKI